MDGSSSLVWVLVLHSPLGSSQSVFDDALRTELCLHRLHFPDVDGSTVPPVPFLWVKVLDHLGPDWGSGPDARL